LHAQLTDELRKEDPSLDRVADIISKDMGMATKILQLVNSAFFGLPQTVANIQEAVVYLGTATIRALVLSLQVFSQFDRHALKGFSIDGLAQHCWETGVLARRIAQAERSGSRIDDQCFLGGLLHDVGHLVLAAGLPEPYARVLRLAKEQNRPLWEVEQGALGAGHAEVGAYLLGLWGLPNPIIEAVAFHHHPSASSTRGFSPLVAVHVADALLLDHGSPGAEPAACPLDSALLAELGLADKIEEWKTRYLQPAT
jgi:HD-like signal output (HDOD) protein